MQEYDFVIHMNRRHTIAGHAEGKPKYKNLDIDITGRGEKIQEDPIRDFVAEIMVGRYPSLSN